MIRKTVAALSAAALSVAALSLAAPPSLAAPHFLDISDSSWAYGAISAMAEAGVINGFPDGTFKPTGVVTYGEFIKMAYLASGGDEPEPAQGEGGWALPYYEASLSAGLFSRHDIPQDALPLHIPRKHMAVVISGALGEVEIEGYDEAQERLSDITPQSSYEYDITKAVALGLITGYPDGTFRPEDTLVRAEAATVIYRLTDEDARQLPADAGSGEADAPTPLERFVPGNPSPFADLAESSVSRRPLSEVLDDYSINKLLTGFSTDRYLLYYEIFEGYPYQMQLAPNLVGEDMLDIGCPSSFGNYLVKDRRIIAEVMPYTLDPYLHMSGRFSGFEYNSGNYDGVWPDFDYVISNVPMEDTAILIPNTLK
ncbi:MAG: S-layer homology domain-containing protein [Clostridiales Family XIII bacterium]|jgi:hypothetical protein|nr:S-layer homology domain-containing protein [Clostridiales Family XIII bacterium]